MITYGLESGADLVARRLHLAGMTSRFEVLHRGSRSASARCRCPGATTWLNALAAIAVGLDLEIPFATIQQGARPPSPASSAGSRCAARPPGITVVDDYGHHPAEIRATLAAAKAGLRRARRRRVPAASLHADAPPARGVRHRLQPGGRPRSSWTSTPRARRRSRASAPRTWPTRIRAHGHRDVTYVGSDRERVLAAPARHHPARRPGADAGRRATWASSARSSCAGWTPARVAGRTHMLGEIRGEVRFKEPLSFHTSLRIGGPADIFVVPQDVDDIRHALMFARARAAAASWSSAAATTCSSPTAACAASSSSSRAASGARSSTARRPWPARARACPRSSAKRPRSNLGGIECLVGIPATIGGALAMNAGTADGAIGDFVQRRLLPPSGRHDRRVQAGRGGLLVQRRSSFPPGAVLVGCRLRLHAPAAGRDPEGHQAAAQA